MSAPTEAEYRQQAADDALELAQLQRALIHRTDIGIAIGRVMERYDMDRHHALATLRRLSQHHNRKLRDIAEELAGDGSLDLLQPTSPLPDRMGRPIRGTVSQRETGMHTGRP